MKSDQSWLDRLPERDGIKSYIYDLCFKPDGSQVVIAVGNRVLVYDANDGDLVHSLKGHRDIVYAVAYSKDGKRFASGGADKQIIIWTSKCEGILKYSHNDSIQCLAYNPVTAQLASATATDFGLWSPEQKSVQKFKVSAKVICCSWTNEGQYLALGQMNGHISIRDRQGEEKVRIERNAPIWCLQWSPPRADMLDVLAVGCWDETLSFYQLSGIQLGKDRDIKFDPCSMSYYGDGEYILLGGSDKKVTLWTKEGVYLAVVCEKDDWVWAVKGRPKHKFVACGSNDGTVSVHSTSFNTVHGLFQDRYAYRDTMTDVIIQHLISEQKVRIKTRDYVKKIAIYKDRLAVQLPDRVLIYETSQNESEFDMHYRMKEKINRKMDCNLLVVTSSHIILCQEKKLQLFSFKGKKVREWILEAVIRYIKVIGGPIGREGLLVGLKNGHVLKIFVDNRFPIQLIKHKCAIRCLDISSAKMKLAIVDENSKVYVYDLITKDILFEDSNATSVAWNSDMDEMFCFSGNNTLCIKTGDFPTHKQKLQGFVVGFKASKIFCLHIISMQTIDVPQSISMVRYLEKKDYNNAYKVACLGVTDSDWRDLAMETLCAMLFDISRKSFIRIRDIRFIELLNRLDLARKSAKKDPSKQVDDSIYLADIYAYQGRYDEASVLYIKNGLKKKAIEMYLDLRQWEKAKSLVEQTSNDNVDDASTNMSDLLRRQAQWLIETNDFRAAAEMLWASKDYEAAIELLGGNGWLDTIMEKCRTLHKSERKALEVAAGILSAAGNHNFAKEIYLKLEDVFSLMKLHIELRKWEDAFELAKQHPELGPNIYLPYAEFLALNDKFDEAQAAFKLAGKPQESMRMLSQLTVSSTSEKRFCDTSYYYWMLAIETLKLVTASSPSQVSPEDKKAIQNFEKYSKLADLYYAYDIVAKYVDDPFMISRPETIFNAAQTIFNGIGTNIDAPIGISKVKVLLALAKQSQVLGAFKLARKVYEKLFTLRLPAATRDIIELGAMTLRSKRFSDPESLLAVCMRCSSPNPFLSNTGENCCNCKHLFHRSFDTFDVLPLVEFEIDNLHLSPEEVYARIETGKISLKGQDGEQYEDEGDYQAMRIETQATVEEEDVFLQQLVNTAESSVDGSFPIIRVDDKCLRSMKKSDVFIQKHAICNGIKTRYYRNIISEVPISMCNICFHFFHQDYYELKVLENKCCPYCRSHIDL